MVWKITFGLKNLASSKVRVTCGPAYGFEMNVQYSSDKVLTQQQG